MPMYDYLCTVCGHRMEVIHGVHGTGPSSCPVCGSPMRKAFVLPAIHFKGSGWAKKDRGDSISTKAAAKATSGAGAEGSSSDGSSSPSDGSAADMPTQGSPSGSAKGSDGEGSSTGADAAAGTASGAD